MLSPSPPESCYPITDTIVQDAQKKVDYWTMYVNKLATSPNRNDARTFSGQHLLHMKNVAEVELKLAKLELSRLKSDKISKDIDREVELTKQELAKLKSGHSNPYGRMERSDKPLEINTIWTDT